MASVEAQTRLVCLTLRREVFVEILGPLEQLMTREKSPQVITQRLLKLQTTPTHMPAEVCHYCHMHALHISNTTRCMECWLVFAQFLPCMQHQWATMYSTSTLSLAAGRLLFAVLMQLEMACSMT